MTKKPLSDLKIRKLKEPGNYCDRDGLRLQVTKNKTSGALKKSWLVRITLPGRKVREMGIGSYDDIPLAEAREKAQAARKLARAGIDPIAQRDAAAVGSAESTKPTFKQCAVEYIEAKKLEWRNKKHAAQWTSTLEAYAYPIFGHLPVDLITIEHILSVLNPIWKTKTETASRVRQRIERVLASAAVRNLRSRENPAQWRNNLEFLLAKPAKVKKVKHHPALPIDELPPFMEMLRRRNSMGALSLEFCILTATRTSETIQAEWSEFDLDGGIWKIPNHRMKSGRVHIVPIFGRTQEILRSVYSVSGNGRYVFPGRKKNSPQCVTVFDKALERWGYDHITTHGFRSSFRDWAAERTETAHEVAEAILAHIILNKTEAAYRRGTMFDRRKALMTEWEKFCLSRNAPANDQHVSAGEVAA